MILMFTPTILQPFATIVAKCFGELLDKDYDVKVNWFASVETIFNASVLLEFAFFQDFYLIAFYVMVQQIFQTKVDSL